MNQDAVCAQLSAWLTSLSIFLFSSLSLAQSVIPDVPADGAISVEQVDAALAAIQAQEGLADETRASVTDLLSDARAQIRNRAAAIAAAEDYSAIIESAPTEIAELRQELALPAAAAPTSEELGITATIGLPELEQQVSRQLANLTTAESSLSGLEQTLAQEETRPQEVRERIEELRALRDTLSQAETVTPSTDEPTVLLDARRLTTMLRRTATTAEINRLEQELLSRDLRLQLLNVRRDLAERLLAEQQLNVAVVQTAANVRRQATAALAEQQASLTEVAAADSHPVVRRLAEGNAELTREMPPITLEIERATRALSNIDDQARQIEQSLSRSRQRLEIGGVSQIIGRLFADERRNLPQVAQYRAEVRERRKALTSIGLAQVRIDEERRNLTPIRTRIEAEMQDVAVDVDDSEVLLAIESEIRELLQRRRVLLDQATSTYNSYLRALGDLDDAQRRLLSAADNYKEFLDQNLLWIPNTSIIGLGTLQDLGPATAWALSPASWQDLIEALFTFCRDAPFWAAIMAILVGLAFGIAGPLRRRFKSINARVGRLSTDHIGLTLEALGIVALRALPVPLAMWLLGVALSQSALHTEFVASASTALRICAPFLYNIMLYRVLCAKGGVAEIHLDWPEDRLKVARRQLKRLAVVGVPVVLVTVLFYSSPYPAYQESFGRLAFIVLMIVLARAVLPFTRFAGQSVLRSDRGEDSADLGRRLRYSWVHLGVFAPLVLAAGAAFGYQYTAASLTGHVVDTFWLILGLIVAKLVVLRWLTLTRRKIALQLALKKSEERKAESDAAEEPEVEGELPTVKRKPIDLDTVDQQTRRLLRAGIVLVGVLAAWGIWSDVLPALNVLQQVSLWSRTATVAGQEVLAPVTLADLLLAIVVSAATVVASKNLPGLIEIAFLQRLTLQPGSRYAINTLVRYVVVIIGTVSVLGIVGWDWSQIQWLVAALSVGLGFGLQEIVANFVSGLIILFERPVRVGDTVTVGQITGAVTRLQIRATTITDWDRKEIVVPNKAFITEQVVNWTLSDPITRIVVPVGIAYGSDEKLAHRIMEDTLKNLPLILQDPPPKVYFIGFGDSSLDFKLYLYSRQLSDRLPLMHAVHEEILNALRENGIEIPFPQRDLHLRSIDKSIKLGDVSPDEH